MVKAAVLYNFLEPLKVESLTLRDPNPDEVVVKMGASGVCHSDLSVQQMKLPFPPPVVLGHEGAGTVEEVGKDVKHLKPGDHVVLSWVENCGRCHHCKGANQRGAHESNRRNSVHQGRGSAYPDPSARLPVQPGKRLRINGLETPPMRETWRRPPETYGGPEVLRQQNRLTRPDGDRAGGAIRGRCDRPPRRRARRSR